MSKSKHRGIGGLRLSGRVWFPARADSEQHEMAETGVNSFVSRGHTAFVGFEPKIRVLQIA